MKKFIFTIIAALSLVSCSVLQNMDSARIMQGGAKVVQAMGITNEQLSEYVKLSVAQLDAQSTVLPATDAYAKRLSRLTGNLRSVEGIPLNFKVYKSAEVNAFACADGSVRVYSGLMDLMNDQEVLGVVGHEIGHIAMQHTLNAYKNALYTSAALDVIASTGNVAAALTDSVLGQLGMSMMQARFSRKQETQADDYGYDFLKGAGINPWYMAMAFEQLMASAGSGTAVQQSSIAEMFSSHPNTAARVERVSQKCAADGFQKPAK